MSTEKLVIIS